MRAQIGAVELRIGRNFKWTFAKIYDEKDETVQENYILRMYTSYVYWHGQVAIK